MAWNYEAKRVAVKAIGTVESSMQYGAINYGDPITVGIGQWYGTRAAGLLTRIKTTYPDRWNAARVDSAFERDLASHAPTNTWWNTYHLDGTENLVPILTQSADVQGQQLSEDLDEYMNVWRSKGGSPDNTDAFIMFCVGWHQGPLYASQAMSTVGYGASLEQVRNAMLNNAVLGRYANRYNTAYAIIASHDSSGVADFGGQSNAEQPKNTPPSTTKVTVKTTKARYLHVAGNGIVVKFDDGSSTQAYPLPNGDFKLTTELVKFTGTTEIVIPGSDTQPGTPSTPNTSSAISGFARGFHDKWLGKGIDFDGYYGFQCYDVANQYSFELYGHGVPSLGYAKNLYDGVSGEEWDRIPNIAGDLNSKPQIGDLVIWTWYQAGHVALCINGGDGNTFRVMEQDGSANGGWGTPCRDTTYNYNSVRGWLRPKKWIANHG